MELSEKVTRWTIVWVYVGFEVKNDNRSWQETVIKACGSTFIAHVPLSWNAEGYATKMLGPCKKAFCGVSLIEVGKIAKLKMTAPCI